MKRHARTLPLFITMVAMLAFAAPGYGALAKPTVTAPTNGASYNTLPHFSWNPVTGADHYEFQIAADAAFTSSVLGFGQDDFITKNTTATVLKTLPNGTYYWRVRAQSLTGSSQSAWSDTQSFTMAWSSTPSPTSPTNGASLVYPQPLLLNWSNVAGAQKYRLTVATDPALGSVLSGYPVDTSATSFSPSARLANGTYYWAVQPIDAEGRAGAQSPIWHFTWNWPTDTSLTVTDLDPSSQVYDPQFSWDPVAGAAKYEIEINSDEGFASGGKVCCSNTTISTSFTPSTLLPADTYYWRVRAIDSSGHAGDWNVGHVHDRVRHWQRRHHQPAHARQPV
jgi:predicted phage tail protein